MSMKSSKSQMVIILICENISIVHVTSGLSLLTFIIHFYNLTFEIFLGPQISASSSSSISVLSRASVVDSFHLCSSVEARLNTKYVHSV